MANSSTKKRAKKKASKKTAASPDKKNGQLSKPAFVDIKNGNLHVRYEDNQEKIYPLQVIEPELHKYISRGARIENGNVVLPVNPFEAHLSPGRLLALSQPVGPVTKDSLPGRILRVWNNFGEFLEKEMKKRGWKSSELTKKTGFAQSTLKNYIHRKTSKPPMDIFFKILKAFNIKLEEL